MIQECKRILTINIGSSSLKCALFLVNAEETLEWSGRVERIGLTPARVDIQDGKGRTLVASLRPIRDHSTALSVLLDWLRDRNIPWSAVGHRVVHGGMKFSEPEVVTPPMLKALAKLEPFDPQHLPQELKAIETVRRLYPSVPQVACFDTAFHRKMPPVAQRYPLPRYLWREGVRRYGFHGLSYEFVVGELARVAGATAAHGRLIIAHLGNGASMAAIRGGRSRNTTMGFSPTGGLMMSTRSGDLDPSVMLYLLRTKRLSTASLSDLVNRRAGLLGVSGTSSDMRNLLKRRAQDSRAAEAIDLFCHDAQRHLGAFAADMGGLDTLIFTAGIGENMPPIRRRICDGLAFLGIRLDSSRNKRNAQIISASGAPVTVRVMKTNEEVVIARHTGRVLQF